MTPIATFFAPSSSSTRGGTREPASSIATVSTRLSCEERENVRVLVPLGTERRFPRNVRGDAVSVADVHGCLARCALEGGVERRNAPRFDLIEIDVESGLVDLHDVDAGGDELVNLGA